MAYLVEFQKRLQRNDWPACLQLWQEYLFSDEVDPQEYANILRAFYTSPLAKAFGAHVEEGLPLLEKVADPEARFNLFRLIIDLQTTNRVELADAVIKELSERFSQEPFFNEKLRFVGLKTKQNFQGAISAFLLFNHLKKGNCLFHTGGWGPGIITDCSFVREEIALKCLWDQRIRTVAFANAPKILEVLPESHFFSRLLKDPQALEDEAFKEPSQVIRLILKDLGPQTAAQLRDLLKDHLIPGDEWTRWWQQARVKIKKDPLIHQPEQAKEPYSLLETQVSSAQRLKSQLETTKNPDERLSLLYTFWKDHPQEQKEVREILLSLPKESLGLPELLLIDECCLNHLYQEELKQLSLDLAEPIKSVESLSLLVLKKRLLQQLQHHPQWPQICVQALQTLSQPTLREMLFKETERLGLLQEVVASWITHPHLHLELLVFYLPKVLQAKQELPFGDEQGQRVLFEAILIGLSQVEQMATARDLVKKIHAMITHDRFALVRKLLQKSSREYVKEYLLLISKSQTLHHDRQILASLAYVVFPDLSKEKAPQETPLWTTQEGYERTQAHLKQLATVETVENAKEIEQARSHGDLRENAEYKFALERRSRLQSEIKRLSTELNKARVITAQDVSSDAVSVGSKVRLKNSHGQQTSYTILGPWDADAEKQILSFQSKLAQQLLDKQVGEEVLLNGETFTIEAISSIFS